VSDPQHRPVPGPPVPAPPALRTDDRFAELAGRPVVEHVEVFDAELERLQRELSTIDQL